MKKCQFCDPHPLVSAGFIADPRFSRLPKRELTNVRSGLDHRGNIVVRRLFGSSGKWHFERPRALYLSKDYRPAFNIEGLLGADIPPGQLVSEKYVAKQRDGADKDEVSADLERWSEFFVRIGVYESPRVVKLGDGDVKSSDELSLAPDERPVGSTRDLGVSRPQVVGIRIG